MTSPPRELVPVVDTVIDSPAVKDAWNSAAPIEDLVTAVILAATPSIVDRAIAQHEAHHGTEHHDLVRDFGGPRPIITVLCGSTRFVDEFNRQRKDLTEAGHIVLSIEVVTTQAREHDPQHVNPALKARLDELHLRKIDLADDVLVLNVDGYIGESTRREIEYATAAGKPIRYLAAERAS